MKEAGRGGGAEGRELKPMVGADEEVAILQEFHFYFFSLFVFTDCTSSGEVFVLCITQDVLLFLFVSLPITWMAEFLSQLRPSPVKVRWKELCHMKQMQYHFIRISSACYVVYRQSQLLSTLKIRWWWNSLHYSDFNPLFSPELNNFCLSYIHCKSLKNTTEHIHCCKVGPGI